MYESERSTVASSVPTKTVLVTGASLGTLGFETCRVIALHDPGLLVLAGRSQAKSVPSFRADSSALLMGVPDLLRTRLEEAYAKIKSGARSANLRLLQIDLGSLESVRKAAREVVGHEENINVRAIRPAFMLID